MNETNQINLDNFKRVHFIGIGGISMSGLAEILHSKGYAVSGSDLKETALTERLRDLGVDIAIGQRAENIRPGIELAVYTAAVKENNPELAAARAGGVLTIDRAALLGALMKRYARPLCVSGTHGKTTTTSMLAEIFMKAGMAPTVTIGGVLPSINSNILVGGDDCFIAEACEYFDSFLKFFPYAGVILNVDYDHLDYFENMAHVVRSYKNFARNISPDGFLVINNEIAQLAEITDGLKCRVLTYGAGGDCAAEDIVYDENGCATFTCVFRGEKLGRLSLSITGEHNVSNALAAVAAARMFKIELSPIREALAAFHGTNRRFQTKGVWRGVTVVDDYAHHPTEIDATLAAARKTKHNRIVCVFQPHTYTRTEKLLPELSRSFTHADHIVVVDIYAARETDPGTINSRMLADAVAAQGKDAVYCPTFDDAIEHLQTFCQPGDLLITMGAGDVNTLGETLLRFPTECALSRD